MSLYTRTGDDGTTGTFGGGRIEKNSSRMHAVGDVDETNAAIGCVRDEALHPLQSLLFDVGADLATPIDGMNKGVRGRDEPVENLKIGRENVEVADAAVCDYALAAVRPVNRTEDLAPEGAVARPVIEILEAVPTR